MLGFSNLHPPSSTRAPGMPKDQSCGNIARKNYPRLSSYGALVFIELPNGPQLLSSAVSHLKAVLQAHPVHHCILRFLTP